MKARIRKNQKDWHVNTLQCKQQQHDHRYGRLAAHKCSNSACRHHQQYQMIPPTYFRFKDSVHILNFAER